MRLERQIIDFFKQRICASIPDARLYLFGSRTDDSALGGDIDLMILSDNQVDKRLIRTIRTEFYSKFGWQKVDIVHFKRTDNSNFKQLIQQHAIEL